MKPDDRSPVPRNPDPPTPLVPDATTGTEQSSSLKRWLPRFIIGAILINLIPEAFGLLGEHYREIGETIRNYANIVFIIGFVIIIFKQLTERT